jgi:hypothetical protein
MAGTRNFSLVRALPARFASLVLALTLCALVALGSPLDASAGTGGARPPGSRAACPALPGTFNNPGQLTMLIRINQMDNVNAWADFDPGDLGRRVQPQDIFVINGRFEQTTPAVAETIAQQIRAAFPCNRIIALNGLNGNPAAPGFIYTLLGSTAGIYAALLDYEPMDWDEARAVNPALPPWTYSLSEYLRRISGFMHITSATLAGAGTNAPARTGVAPIDNGFWDYGQMAKAADRQNLRLGSPHAGLQSVQTQGACQLSAGAFGTRISNLFHQYKFRTIIKIKKVHLKHGKVKKKKIRKEIKIKKAKQPNVRNLATQISFSDTPDPSSPLPISNVSAARADSCVENGVAHGQYSYFFFASTSSMKLLFQQPYMASVRPGF